MSPTVEEKVDVEAIEEVSTSFAGLAGLILGEAGWNSVGGRSFGKRPVKAGNPLGMLTEYAVDVVQKRFNTNRLKLKDTEGLISLAYKLKL